MTGTNLPFGRAILEDFELGYPITAEERQQILDYCAEDVEMSGVAGAAGGLGPDVLRAQLRLPAGTLGAAIVE
jgi:hypothetical protein